MAWIPTRALAARQSPCQFINFGWTRTPSVWQCSHCDCSSCSIETDVCFYTYTTAHLDWKTSTFDLTYFFARSYPNTLVLEHLIHITYLNIYGIFELRDYKLGKIHYRKIVEYFETTMEILVEQLQTSIAILTYWGRVTHICVSRQTIIGSDNGLPPGRRQAIIWTNAGILLIGPLGTNFTENLIEILTCSFTKIRLKVSSAKWRPFCLGLNVLMQLSYVVLWAEMQFQSIYTIDMQECIIFYTAPKISHNFQGIHPYIVIPWKFCVHWIIPYLYLANFATGRWIRIWALK